MKKLTLAIIIIILFLVVGSQPAAAANVRPDASFAFFPDVILSGEPVRFVSYACDPRGRLAEQAWDLDNDGRFDDATGRVVTHSFTDGTHRVRLRATDRQGAATVGREAVVVYNGVPEDRVLRPFDPPRLRPRPLVRLAGELSPRGARIQLLTVRAPVCSRVTVLCEGPTCPLRRADRVSDRTRLRFRAFDDHTLLAGVKLEILVRKRDRIGKYTRFRIRRGKAPARADACLRFEDTTGSRCPGA